MSESVLYSCLILLAIGSIWAFGALDENCGKSNEVESKDGILDECNSLSIPGLYHTVVASSVGYSDFYFYWTFVFIGPRPFI